MNFSKIVGKTKFFFKKNAPTLLVVGGTAITVASGVYACFKTPKALKVIDDGKEKLNVVKECTAAGECATGAYTAEDGKKDTVIIVTQTVLKVAKEYAVPLAGAAAGVTMILCGNRMHRKRTAAATAAYASLASMFAAYRDNAKKLYGEDADNAIRSGKRVEKHEEQETVVAQTESVYSDYAKIFDEASQADGRRNFHPGQPVMNAMFLDRQEALANSMLNTQGYLFLNDVYDLLGMPKTQAGFYVGWLAKGNGGCDGFVSFNHKNLNFESSARFQAGEEDAVILDFNVDGPIMDMVTRNLERI